MDYFRNILLLETTERTSRKLGGREQRGRNALQRRGRAATAAVRAARLREHTGTVQPGGSRLEGQHAANHAVRQAQRTGHAAGDGHPHVRAAGHRDTRRARRRQLTTAFADTVPYVQTPS
ncbi:uncharacterized protein LOC112693908 [Sipha flava]|uniref:Uncharacterized protein LOC112693908 n=1 Tax=Sipha flava TaxID=143950 RepID=A0A8B8GPK7_9HEMI|nr:uncharacterized protein LOC112693908 [Sipha flava]XP_025424952.1 uncharacterized protein LOC112693908 [Sipha flava]XP_025424953.1 uncharacterized protein LOC112693908 [Sipha flava]XP_025424955.1 uncharacterized protein LOC112693908 [Sipha flava]XP_025424956.1 uncharacterized protein LOC112693908 [Sipha flava]